MLKLKLSKTDWEKLTPAVQELYAANGDDYALDVEAGQTDDNGELKRALARTKADLTSERTARRTADTKLDELDTNDARKRGDIDKLTTQWETKINDNAAAHAAEVAALRNHISTTTVDAIVSGLAGRVTGTKENAALLDPHIRKNLSVEFTDDGVQVMMAASGGDVPLDMAKFEKSVVDNPSFAAIIVGNRSSGGDASGTENNGRTGGAFQTDNRTQSSGPLDLATASPKDLVAALSKP